MSRFRRGMVALVVGAALAAVAPVAAAAPRSMLDNGDPNDPNKAAIQQVIQRSNDEQVQAVASRNVALMADTLTDDRYSDLSSTILDMLNTKVTAISLLNLDWGPIIVASDNSSATAITYETWQITSTAGTVQDAPMRNDYTLVFDSSTSLWKIRSDIQAQIPSQTPNGITLG